MTKKEVREYSRQYSTSYTCYQFTTYLLSSKHFKRTVRRENTLCFPLSILSSVSYVHEVIIVGLINSKLKLCTAAYSIVDIMCKLDATPEGIPDHSLLVAS